MSDQSITDAAPVSELRHQPTDDCNGLPFGQPCVECHVRVCPCERAYGHDCEG